MTITPIRDNPEYTAKCPSCGCSDWKIVLDDVGLDWEKILGTRCSGCGFMVDWVLCEIEKEEE